LAPPVFAVAADADCGIDEAKKAPAPAPNNFPNAPLRSTGLVNAFANAALVRTREIDSFISKIGRLNFSRLSCGSFVVMGVLWVNGIHFFVVTHKRQRGCKNSAETKNALHY